MEHHDSTLAGHPGQYKTWELITRDYWWPRMGQDIKEYIKGCEKCQTTKKHRTKPRGYLHPHDIPTEPWQIVGTDMIGELPMAGGFNAISVYVCHFTKRIRLVPTHITINLEGMARMYRDKIFATHGLPKVFVHD